MKVLISENILKCADIKITPEMASFVLQYDSAEQLLRSGGIDIAILDRAAFGFSTSDLKTLHPSKLKIKWHDDLENVLNKIAWAKTVDLSEPIEVSYSKGKFFIEDGHHRYYAAKLLNKELNVVVEIKDNPITLLGGKMSYDDFHRCVYDRAKNNNYNIR